MTLYGRFKIRGNTISRYTMEWFESRVPISHGCACLCPLHVPRCQWPDMDCCRSQKFPQSEQRLLSTTVLCGTDILNLSALCSVFNPQEQPQESRKGTLCRAIKELVRQVSRTVMLETKSFVRSVKEPKMVIQYKTWICAHFQSSMTIALYNVCK